MPAAAACGLVHMVTACAHMLTGVTAPQPGGGHAGGAGGQRAVGGGGGRAGRWEWALVGGRWWVPLCVRGMSNMCVFVCAVVGGCVDVCALFAARPLALSDTRTRAHAHTHTHNRAHVYKRTHKPTYMHSCTQPLAHAEGW